MATKESQARPEESNVSAILPRAMKDELEATAKAEDRSISGVIRQALREYFERRRDGVH